MKSMTSISNKLCTRNLQMIDGNKKSMPQNIFYFSGKFVTFSKISPCVKKEISLIDVLSAMIRKRR